MKLREMFLCGASCVLLSITAVSAPALADTPVQPETLEEYRSELRDLRREAKNMNGGRSVDEAVAFNNNEFWSMKADQDALAETIDRLGGETQTMRQQARELDQSWSSDMEDVGSSTVQEAGSSAATAALSTAAQRLAFWVGAVMTAGEYGYRKYVKEDVEGTIEEYVAQNQITISELYTIWHRQNDALKQNIRDGQRLKEIKERHDRLEQEMYTKHRDEILNYGRTSRTEEAGPPRPSGAATRYAVTGRVDDAAGDEEEKQKYLDNAIRRSDGTPAAPRRAPGTGTVTPATPRQTSMTVPGNVSGAGPEEAQTASSSSYSIPAFAPAAFQTETVGYLAGFGYGVGEYETAATGIGFQRGSGEEESFAGFSDDDVQLEDYTLNLLIHRKGGWDTSFGLSYATGDSYSDFQIDQGNGIDTGLVYGGLSPSGSSGVSIGDGGLWGFTERELDSLALKGKRMAPLYFGDVVRPYYFGEIRHVEQDWSMYGDFSVSYDYSDYMDGYEVVYSGSQTRDQHVSDTYYGAGVGLSTTIPVGERLFASAYGSGALYYRRSEFNSHELNTCSFCPMYDQSFSLEFDEEDNGTAFEALLGFILNYQFNRNFGFALYGHSAWLSEAGNPWNPNSGDQVYYDELETILEIDDALRWRLGVAATYSWDEEEF